MSAASSSSVAKAVQDVAEAAEEFVDKMNPTEEDADAEGEEGEGSNGGGNTLEERKKKLEQLRQRMVGLTPSCHGS